MAFGFCLSLRQQAGIIQEMWVCIDALQCNLLRCSQARDAYPNGRLNSSLELGRETVPGARDNDNKVIE